MNGIVTGYSHLLLLTLTIAYGIAILFNSSSIPFCNADTSCYLGLSKSISEQKSYVFNFEPHTKYPPCFPVILSTVRLIYRNCTDQHLITITAFFGLLGVLVSYWLIKPFNSFAALIGATFLVTSPVFFKVSTSTILSDLPFFTFSTCALLTANILSEANNFIKRINLSVLFCITMFASELTRTIGIVLPISCILWISSLAIRDKYAAIKKLKVFFIPIGLTIAVELLWLAWSSSKYTILYEGQYMDSYFAQMLLIDPHNPELGTASLLDFGVRILKNFRISIAHLGNIFFHLWITPSFLSVFLLPTLFCMLTGLSKRVFNKKTDLIFWYFLSYSGILLLWPFDEGPRFVLPLFPIACLFICEGALRILNYIKSSNGFDLRITTAIVSIPAILSIHQIVSGQYSSNQKLINYVFWLSGLILSLILILNNLKNGRACFVFKIPFNSGVLSRRLNIAVYSIVILVCAIGIQEQFKIAITNRCSKQLDIPNYPLILAANWLGTNLPENSIICATQKEIIFQYSQRRTVPFPVSSSYNLLNQTLNNLRADYLVIYDEGDYPYFFPTDNQRYQILSMHTPSLLTNVFQTTNCSIYKINRNLFTSQ